MLLLYIRPVRDNADHKQFEITRIVLTVVRAVLRNVVQIGSSQCIYIFYLSHGTKRFGPFQPISDRSEQGNIERYSPLGSRIFPGSRQRVNKGDFSAGHALFGTVHGISMDYPMSTRGIPPNIS